MGNEANRVAELEQENQELRAQIARLKKYRELATHDPMTHLGNRRLFDRTIRKAVARALRSGHQCSLILADVNDFKSINDTYGHPVGDAAIRHIGKCLSQALFRCEDEAFRFTGGDEFAVILEQTGREGMGDVAARIVLTFEFEPLRLADGSELPITLSMGGTTFYPLMETPVEFRSSAESGSFETGSLGGRGFLGDKVDELYEDADAALYKAKQRKGNGKSSFIVHSL